MTPLHLPASMLLRALILQVAAILVASIPPALYAMDAENATTVASCLKHPGYEKEGEKILDILHSHKMQAYQFYHIDHTHIYEAGESVRDKSEATEWAIVVHIEEADYARELIASSLPQGSQVMLQKEEKRERAYLAESARLAEDAKPKKSLFRRILHSLGL